MWKHRNEPQYWTWESLTDLNKVTDSPNLNHAVAWNIITVLEGKGFLLSFPEFQKDGQIIKYPFKLHLGDLKAWRRIKRSPSCCTYLINLWEDFSPKLYAFIIGIFSLAIASVIVYALQRYIDIKWPAPPN